MQYTYLGNTGLKVSRLALGTMTFGGDSGAAGWQMSEASSFQLLDAFVAAGGNFIDTADIYSKGESERIIGRWLSAYPEKRRGLVIATKCRFPVDAATAGPNDVGLSRAHIFRAIADSLTRLGLTSVDLFQCHSWDAGTPIEETLRALNDIVVKGLATYVGWSNVTGAQLQKIVCESKRLGLPVPASLQQQYSLLCRETEWDVLDVARDEGVALLPWSPLKGGWLSGKMTRQAAPVDSRAAWADASGAVLQSHPSFAKYKEDERVWRLLEGLKELALELNATVPQVAIAWLLAQPGVTSVIVGAKNLTQLEDNLGALTVKLSPLHIATLETLSAIPIPYPFEMVKRVNAGRKRI